MEGGENYQCNKNNENSGPHFKSQNGYIYGPAFFNTFQDFQCYLQRKSLFSSVILSVGQKELRKKEINF